MSGPRYQIHFLSPNATLSSQGDKPSAGKRSLEAARAEARSHAARVSHPGAKGSRPSIRKVRIQPLTTGGLGSPSLSPRSEATSTGTSPSSTSDHSEGQAAPADKPTLNTTLPVLRFRLRAGNGRSTCPAALQPPGKEKEDDLAERRDRAAPVRLPKEISKSALDPFISPPLELSVADEHLLHLYLSTVPDQIYGSAAHDVSAVIRHGTVGVVATNELVVMWLLLVVESQVVSFQPTKWDRELSILNRRSMVYRQMNERLSNQKSSLTDAYILAVAVAGASEHRMGNTQGAQYHLSAVRRLLELRGGLASVRDVTYPLGLMVVNIFIEQGVEGLWKTHIGLQKKVANLAQWIRDAQSWNFALRSHATSARQVDDYPTPDSDDVHQPLWSAIDRHDRRVRAFAPKTALFDYVALPPGELDTADCRFYLSILFAINRALHAFRDSESTTNAYLIGLTTAVEMSALHNFTLRAGGAKLPSLLLLLMIAHNAVHSGERTHSTGVVFHVEEVTEMVEIMMMTSPRTRMHVLRAFESWLTTPITSTKHLSFVNNAQLDILAGETQETWLSSQAKERMAWASSTSGK